MSPTAAVVLRSARTRAQLTQSQLSANAGVTQSVVSAYESGTREPSFSTLQRLVRATGFQLTLVIDETPPHRSPSLLDHITTRRDAVISALGELGAKNIRVFGSAARGDEHDGSDIDLLVDLADNVGLFSLARMKSEAERILGKPVDIVPADSLKPSIAHSAFRDAVPL